MGPFSGENKTGPETPNTSRIKQHKTKWDNFINISQKKFLTDEW